MKVIFLKNQCPSSSMHYVSQKVYAVEDGSCIVVSAADVPGSGPEVYIFPSDREGHIIDWAELPGSITGSLCHDKALQSGGYVECDEKWNWAYDKDASKIEEGYYKFTNCIGIPDDVYHLNNAVDCFIHINNMKNNYFKYVANTYIKENQNRIIKLTKDDLIIRDIIE
jgi:hypothetical protein